MRRRDIEGSWERAISARETFVRILHILIGAVPTKNQCTHNHTMPEFSLFSKNELAEQMVRILLHANLSNYTEKWPPMASIDN